MSELIASSRYKVVIGTGITGLSVARFLVQQGEPFVLVDTRISPPNAALIAKDFPDVAVCFGELDRDLLANAEELIVSPGIAVSHPAIENAKSCGVPVVGDIELFARAAQAPIVAITGSNAKSTVTTLVGAMAEQAGINVAVGGNLGTPALDLLDAQVELYVMELSSFQLETVSRLNAKVATILNLSADHMDRYATLGEYHAAKLRIYFGAENIVFNTKDTLTQPPLAKGVTTFSFGGKAEFKRFGLLERDEQTFLAWQFEPLLNVNQLKIAGKHNIDNALAALALGHAAGLSMASMIEALKTFKGLPHRCEFVLSHGGVDFYNDSKGTNVGATLAALNGLARLPKKLVLIAGGDGKGAPFDDLVPTVSQVVRAVVLIGRDAPLLFELLKDKVRCEFADSMSDAVNKAYGLAEKGDAVLLSPACASLDMFKNYNDRGEQFCQAVEELSA